MIMCGRNNKLCDQKSRNSKGVRQVKKPTKKILPWVKRTILNVYGRQKKQQPKLNYKNNKKIVCIS